MASISLELAAVAPLDFDLVLHYLRSWPAIVLETQHQGVLEQGLRIGTHEVLLATRAIGTVDRPRLLLTVSGREVDREVALQAAALVSRALMLEVDPVPFWRAIAADPILAARVEKFRAIRPVRIINPFEALLWAIMCQQINLAFGRRMKESLIELCGARMELEGRVVRLFPTPAQVLALEAELLKQRQWSRQKIAYSKEVAAAIEGGQLDFQALAALPFEHALAALTAIKGIGRWTAEYVMLRALGFAEAIPAGDVGLKNAIGKAYGLGRAASEAEIRELARGWGRWSGWAAFYWWMELLEGRAAAPGLTAAAPGG